METEEEEGGELGREGGWKGERERGKNNGVPLPEPDRLVLLPPWPGAPSIQSNLQTQPCSLQWLSCSVLISSTMRLFCSEEVESEREGGS